MSQAGGASLLAHPTDGKRDIRKLAKFDDMKGGWI
jgi:hypothetical protein